MDCFNDAKIGIFGHFSWNFIAKKRKEIKRSNSDGAHLENLCVLPLVFMTTYGQQILQKSFCQTKLLIGYVYFHLKWLVFLTRQATQSILGVISSYKTDSPLPKFFDGYRVETLLKKESGKGNVLQPNCPIVLGNVPLALYCTIMWSDLRFLVISPKHCLLLVLPLLLNLYSIVI